MFNYICNHDKYQLSVISRIQIKNYYQQTKTKIMRHIILTFMLIFSTLLLQAQAITVKGVIKEELYSRPSTVGDSILLFGYKGPQSGEGGAYLIHNASGYEWENGKAIQISTNDKTFWDILWFRNVSAEFLNNTKQFTSISKTIDNDANDYLQNLSSNNLIWEDSYIDDYLTNLVQMVHPTPISRNKNGYLKVRILKSDNEDVFSFDNGSIYLTTALIAKCQSERQLLEKIMKQIAHIEIASGYYSVKQQIRAENLAAFWGGVAAIATGALMAHSNQKHNTYFTGEDAFLFGLSATILSSSIMESSGARKNNKLDNLAGQLVADALKKDFSNLKFLSDSNFRRSISNVTRYMAWQYFYKSEYKNALEIIDEIIKLEIATNEDYLLKSKIYRYLYNSEQRNAEAVNFLNAARQATKNPPIDFAKELALFYIRLGDITSASNALTDYKNFMEANQNEENVKELAWAESLLIQIKIKK
jgi:hypothetical protein